MFSVGIEWAQESDTLYLQLSENPIVRSVEFTPDVIFDLDLDDVVVGIDIQHLSEVVKERIEGAVTATHRLGEAVQGYIAPGKQKGGRLVYA